MKKIYKCINPRHRETGLKFPCKRCVEVVMQIKEEIRKSELRYWQKMQHKATVKLNKKKNVIEITYPLPKDYDLLRNLSTNH